MRQAPRFFAQSGMGIVPVRVNWRISIIETPVSESRERSRNHSYVVSAQGMIFSAGSVSYGNQTAAAAADVVCWLVSSAKMVTFHSRSAKTTPQVRPETPAPITAARFCMWSVFQISLLTTNEHQWTLIPENKIGVYSCSLAVPANGGTGAVPPLNVGTTRPVVPPTPYFMIKTAAPSS